jgi:hyaluronate lyase
MSINRRDLLRYGVAAGVSTAAVGTLSGAIGAATASADPAPAGDAEKIIAAYRELQVGRDIPSPERTGAVKALDQVAVQYDSTMNVGADQLWTDLPTGPGSNYFPTMYYRLRTIAVDYATPGSALSAKAGQAQRIATALETLYRLEYNENTSEIGNWYSYEIGVPYWVIQILVCMRDQLAPADLQRYLRPVLRFNNDPNFRTATPGLVETGANRADKSLISIVAGALAGDSQRIANAIAAVTDQAGGGAASLVARVTKGDGYHTDGSFIQHDVVPYPGHYGLVLLTAAAGIIHVTEGTATQLSAAVKQKFFDTVADVYAPFVASGAMMEPVRGRMLSRQGETGYDAGHQLTAAVVLLARHATGATQQRLVSLATKWIKEGRWAPYFTVENLVRFSGGLQMVGVPEVEFAKELSTRDAAHTVSTHRVFPQQDRMVHVTPTWSASLGVGSTRICRYESINGQNLHGWYVGDGVLYTFLPGDQGNYSDAYWPTVDATALPGTTEKDATPPPLQATPLATTAWVGGSRWDDRHGAFGLDFVSQDGTLSAKKSWFFTPDGVVCLGAGITDATGAHVRTTIENRNLGENGARRLTAQRHWLHLDGVAGYVLLDDASVVTSREDRTGTWFGVDTGANTHGTTVPYTRRYQKIIIDHGPNPTGASYAYVVLPGATPWETAGARGRYCVLANTAAVQAVQLDSDIVAANFWAAGSVGRVTVSAPASVLWSRGWGGWTFALSDPTQLQTSITVTVAGVGSHTVDVSGSLGATHTFKVAW